MGSSIIKSSTLYILSLGYCLYGSVAFGMEDIAFDTFGKRLDISVDTMVADSVHVNVENINILDTLNLVNKGIIKSNINICNGCKLYVRNFGELDASVTKGTDAKLFQLISGRADMKKLNIDTAFDVVVEGVDDVNIVDLFEMGTNIEQLVLKDSSVYLDSVPNNWNGKLILVGDVSIRLDGNISYDKPLFNNVSNQGTLTLERSEVNKLYKYQSYVDGDALYVSLLRETDYYKIFSDDLGVFLNKLRERDEDKDLLYKLDNASDMNAIHRIMNRSVRFNPEILIQPIRVLNKFKSFENIENMYPQKIGFNIDKIWSENAGMYIANIFGVVGLAPDLYLKADGYVGVVSDTDDFNGNVYGGGLALSYVGDLFLGDIAAGMNFASFDIGNVFYAGHMDNNPSGISEYFSADVGIRAFDNSKFYLIPMVGVLVENYKVGDAWSDKFFDMRAGMNAGIRLIGNDINYDYGVRVWGLSDGTIMLGGCINFLAPDDRIGGGLELDVLLDDVTSYKISVGAKYLF